MAAWHRQTERQGVANARLDHAALQLHCLPSPTGEKLLATAIERLGLSARAFHRILRVARTVADLDASDTITDQHITEAVGFRRLDRV
jgi:magnesium chelatase family protein